MFFKNKKGISAIIATLLLVALTIVLVVIVWTVINGLVSQKINQSSACFGNFDPVTINDQYTCYNSSSHAVQFSLDVGSTNVDGVIVSISSSGTSSSISINSTAGQVPNLSLYNGTTTVMSPAKNSGITYLYNWTGSDVPNSIQIAPIVSGQQCGASNAVPLDDCNLLS